MKLIFAELLKKPRKKYHPIQHKLRKKHKLSKNTVFYMKEYGPHSNVAGTIIKESVKILLLSSIISSLGGIALENIRTILVAILPLVIILPALNAMVGDFGIIVASKFTAALFMGKVKGRLWHLHFLHRLFWMVFAIALMSAIYLAGLGMILSIISGFVPTLDILGKLIYITLISTSLLVLIIFLVSVIGGIWIYKKGEDPNNFLIPITTSLADFGSLLMFSYLVRVFF